MNSESPNEVLLGLVSTCSKLTRERTDVSDAMMNVMRCMYG